MIAAGRLCRSAAAQTGVLPASPASSARLAKIAVSADTEHCSRRRRKGCVRRMLPVSWDTVRLFFHVLAATVWVGGQLTLAALVPALRRFGADVPRAAARRFNQVAWIAFAVLIVTGIWNVAAVSSGISHSASYRDTLIVKLVVVGISGLTAALHARSRSAAGLAVFGALTGVSALAALFLGVLLAG